MLNGIWSCAMMAAVLYGVMSGRIQEMGNAIMTAGPDALQLMMTLMATMTLWSGLMEILSETGDVRWLGRGIRRMTAPLFGELRDEACWDAISLNLSANLFGLGNAATPAGVRAAQLLAAQGETGLTALAALLAMNNAGLQILPTTVIMLRQAHGSSDPAGVWVLSMAAAAASAVVSMGGLMLIRRRRKGGIAS